MGIMADRLLSLVLFRQFLQQLDRRVHHILGPLEGYEIHTCQGLVALVRKSLRRWFIANPVVRQLAYDRVGKRRAFLDVDRPAL